MLEGFNGRGSEWEREFAVEAPMADGGRWSACFGEVAMRPGQYVAREVLGQP